MAGFWTGAKYFLSLEGRVRASAAADAAGPKTLGLPLPKRAKPGPPCRGWDVCNMSRREAAG